MKNNEEVKKFNDEVGKRVRARRIALELSQEELAAKANLSSVFISNVENGESGIVAYNLVQLADALEMSVLDILFGSGERIRERIFEKLSLIESLDEAAQKIVWHIFEELVNGLATIK